MVPCPRCKKANSPSAARCAACGTPLAFREDPAPQPLTSAIDLDRRRGDRAPPPVDLEGRGEGEVLAGPVAPDDSAWSMGSPRAEGEEPGEIGEPRATPGVVGDHGVDQAEGWFEGAPEAEGPGPDDPAPLAAAVPADALPPAPPARRAVAWAIDGALLGAAAVLLPALLLSGLPSPAEGRTCCFFGSEAAGILLLSEAFVALVGFVYVTVSHALGGATLGKRIARIRVVDVRGLQPSPLRSLVRSAWGTVSVALLGAGLLPALLTPSRRALHDLLAGTRVVDDTFGPPSP